MLGLGNAGRRSLNASLLMEQSDEAHRGRVMGIYMMNFGLTPLAAIPLGIPSSADQPTSSVRSSRRRTSSSSAGRHSGHGAVAGAVRHGILPCPDGFGPKGCVRHGTVTGVIGGGSEMRAVRRNGRACMM